MALFKTKYPKVFASSVNPHKLSLSWRGGVLAGIAALVAFTPVLTGLGVNINVTDLQGFQTSIGSFFDAIDTLIVSVLAAFASGQLAWGILRKILVGIGLIKPKAV